MTFETMHVYCVRSKTCCTYMHTSRYKYNKCKKTEQVHGVFIPSLKGWLTQLQGESSAQDSSSP